MSRTVSARISKETHDQLRERCNKAGCTMNDWIEASINYFLTGYSDFDFGDEDEKEECPDCFESYKDLYEELIT